MRNSKRTFQFPWGKKQKVMYIIAGCNGAGKTTAFKTYLSQRFDNPPFVNPDEIAMSICPEDPRSVDRQAAVKFIEEVDILLEGERSFYVETTLSAKSYKQRILKAQEKGFKVVLFFFWLDNVETAVRRVAQRVSEGGHYILEADIRRHYERGLLNLENIFKPIVDVWEMFDNSYGMAAPMDGGAHESYNQIGQQWLPLETNDFMTSILPLLKEKAEKGESVIYSLAGRNVELTAEDVLWVYDKLTNGIDQYDREALERWERKGQDAEYYFGEKLVHIPVRIIIEIQKQLGNW